MSRGTHPGEIDEGIALVLGVANSRRLEIEIIGNLIVVAAQRGHQPQLVNAGGIENQRSEIAESRTAIVQDFGDRGLQPILAAIPAHAGVVGKTIAVAAEADLIVGGIEAAVVENQLAFTIALEAGARDHVEHSIGAVAKLGRVAATLHLDGINVLRIELRANIAGDVGIGHGYTIN